MIKKKDRALILVEEWQYTCCGQDFEIGDYMCFGVTPLSKSGYKGAKLLSNSKIDYLYEDCPGGIGDIAGKISRITLLIKNKDGLYEETKEYSSGKALSKDPRFSYMLLTLEDFTYKKFNEKTFIYNEVVILGTLNELGISVAKEFKRIDYNIRTYDKNNDNILLIDKELHKIKSFSKAECYPVNLEDKEKLETEDYKIWVVISNEKIYNNLIDKYENERRNCDIYHVNLDKKVIEHHKIISNFKCRILEKNKKISVEVIDDSIEVENNVFDIEGLTIEEISKYLVLKVINDKSNMFNKK